MDELFPFQDDEPQATGPDQSTWTEDEKKRGFSDAEIEICTRVLNAFRGKGAMIMESAYQSVRGAVGAFSQEMEQFKFGGLGELEYHRRKRVQALRHAQHHRLKDMDRAHINQVKLRSERLNALRSLAGDGSNLLEAPPSQSAPLLTHPDHMPDSGSPAPSAAAAGPVSLESLVVVDGELHKKSAEAAAAARAESKAAPAKPTGAESDPSSSSAPAVRKRPPRAERRKLKAAREQAEAQNADHRDFENGVVRTKPAVTTASASNAAATSNPLSADFIESKASHKPGTADLKQPADVTIEDGGEEDVGNNTNSNAAGERPRVLFYPRSCYVCKVRFHQLHEFYDQLCPSCAALNWEKRNQVADMTGRVCIVTGARVKIGYYCGLKLLRCGALVIATSRFPHDTVRRYSQEKDFEEWKHRLHVFGLDLRDLKSVVRFTEIVTQRYKRLDAIINNAAQTVRRPPAYYKHLLPLELQPRKAMPNEWQGVLQVDPHIDESHPDYIRLCGGGDSQQLLLSDKPVVPPVAVAGTSSAASESDQLHIQGDAVMSSVFHTMADSAHFVGNVSAALSQAMVVAGDHVESEALFPTGKFDVTGQQLDLRNQNSWLLLLDQVDPSELVEVFAINALAPFIINSRLKPLMTRIPDVDKYIINVSAMEGKFYRYKGPQHPHTNMAKAALNMLTRTSAQDYAQSRIYMNSVDTGWINDENPFEKSQRVAQTNFQTPIDEVDAMARILDPVLVGVRTGVNTFGQFYKDYRVTEW